jgi:hypothetical protein
MLTDREKLARQLRSQMHWCGTCADPDSPATDHWLRLADACIRQMKWAWHAARWSNPETMSWEATLLEDGEMDCGLAPDDWEVK